MTQVQICKKIQELLYHTTGKHITDWGANLLGVKYNITTPDMFFVLMELESEYGIDSVSFLSSPSAFTVQKIAEIILAELDK